MEMSNGVGGRWLRASAGRRVLCDEVPPDTELVERKDIREFFSDFFFDERTVGAFGHCIEIGADCCQGGFDGGNLALVEAEAGTEVWVGQSCFPPVLPDEFFQSAELVGGEEPGALPFLPNVGGVLERVLGAGQLIWQCRKAGCVIRVESKLLAQLG